PPKPPLFPYTTLFRSKGRIGSRELQFIQFAEDFRRFSHRAVQHPLQVYAGLSGIRVVVRVGRQQRAEGTGQRIAGSVSEEPYARSEEHTSELQSRENL